MRFVLPSVVSAHFLDVERRMICDGKNRHTHHTRFYFCMRQYTSPLSFRLEHEFSLTRTCENVWDSTQMLSKRETANIKGIKIRSTMNFDATTQPRHIMNIWYKYSYSAKREREKRNFMRTPFLVIYSSMNFQFAWALVVIPLRVCYPVCYSIFYIILTDPTPSRRKLSLDANDTKLLSRFIISIFARRIARRSSYIDRKKYFSIIGKIFKFGIMNTSEFITWLKIKYKL